ncbi:MAG: hypothetical protein KDD98_02635 [Sphingomonadaceae bacterium]|nr:hypothetical protein [Sphingomonadaceae bacterium]
MSRTYSENLTRRTVAMALFPLAVLFAGKAVMQAMGMDGGAWFKFGLVFCGFAAFFVLARPYWVTLDDMQRQGQAVSGYWGGMAGLAVTACIIAGGDLYRSEFTVGVATLMVLQLVCSMSLYGFWWLKGRGFSFRPGE